MEIIVSLNEMYYEKKTESDSKKNKSEMIRNIGKPWVLIFILSLTTSSLYAQYTELYRPQYHFSPKTGWIGDPDGLVRYNNKYHLFWNIFRL